MFADSRTNWAADQVSGEALPAALPFWKPIDAHSGCGAERRCRPGRGSPRPVRGSARCRTRWSAISRQQLDGRRAGPGRDLVLGALPGQHRPEVARSPCSVPGRRRRRPTACPAPCSRSGRRCCSRRSRPRCPVCRRRSGRSPCRCCVVFPITSSTSRASRGDRRRRRPAGCRAAAARGSPASMTARWSASGPPLPRL